jgi:2-(1,2-epoxy-1,2-dihydrophenyl)acetyl-CoA isomerase
MAKYLVLSGREITAEDAAQMGLVLRVVSDDDLPEEAKRMAAELSQGPTVALGLAKSLLNHATSSSLHEMIELESHAYAAAVATNDHAEGVSAFHAKRAPAFRGR